jgi:hypothetical protein
MAFEKASIASKGFPDSSAIRRPDKNNTILTSYRLTMATPVKTTIAAPR